MVWLRSFLFNLLFWCWTIVLGLLCCPLLVHTKLAKPVPHIWISLTLWLLRVICGLRVELRNESLKGDTARIYAAKHQSALDTLVLWKDLDGPSFILKRSLLWIPVFGWYLWRMKPIAIDRRNKSDALRRIEEQAVERIASGQSIMIFPEGTRTRPGATVPYKTAGISVLYQKLILPVTPIALNTGVFWARNAFLKRAGVAVFEYLPVVEAGIKTDDMLAAVKDRIETGSTKLLKESMVGADV